MKSKTVKAQPKPNLNRLSLFIVICYMFLPYISHMNLSDLTRLETDFEITFDKTLYKYKSKDKPRVDLINILKSYRNEVRK